MARDTRGVKDTVGSKRLNAATGCVLLLLFAAGCTATPPSDFYVLIPMATADSAPAGGGQDSLSVSVGPVKIPEYLNRAQIVSRAGPHRLDVDEFSRWGGPLTSNLSSVVAQNLTVLLRTDNVFVFPGDDPVTPRFRVIVFITRFDGTLGEHVELDARWVVTGPRRREELGTGRTVVREPIDGGGYESYVAAQSRALDVLSREVAAEISVLAGAGS